MFPERCGRRHQLGTVKYHKIVAGGEEVRAPCKTYSLRQILTFATVEFYVGRRPPYNRGECGQLRFLGTLPDLQQRSLSEKLINTGERLKAENDIKNAIFGQ